MSIIFQDIRENNEQVRIANELIRNNQELVRQKNEIIRIDNENKRIKNENTRISQENIREQNEDVRKKQEDYREKAYSDFITATKDSNIAETIEAEVIGARGEDFKNLRERIDNLHIGIESNKTNLDKVNDLINSSMNECSAKDSELNVKIEKNKADISKNADEINKTNIRVNTNTENIIKTNDELKRNVKVIEDRLKGINDNITGNDGDIGNIKNELAQIEIDTNGISTKVSKIEENNGVIVERVSKIEERADKISLSVTEVDKKADGVVDRISKAESKITANSIINSISEGIKGGNALNTVSTTLDKNGFTVHNGAISIENNENKKVLHGDSDGNLVMNGELKTNSPTGELELKGNTLKGNLLSQQLPTFSCGIWNPNGNGEVGFVSVGQTNSDYSDDNGCLWMSPIKGDGDKKAVLEYSRAVGGDRSNMINGRMEFAASGSVSVITHGVGQPFMGLWINNEGYLYPYKGNESFGSTNRRWGKAYFGDAYGTTWNGNSTRRIKSGIEYLTKRNEENVSHGYMFLKTNQPVEADYKKEDFYEFVRDINYATFIYDTEKAKNNGVETLNRKDNSDKITCGFILEDMANIPNKVKDLIIKPHFDNNGNRVEGENENYIDLNSYYNILGVALQQAIERIETKDNEIKKLEERLSKLESIMIKE